jgi:hypothetical protein
MAAVAAAAKQYVNIRRFSPGARHPSDNWRRKVLAFLTNLCDIPIPICMKPNLLFPGRFCCFSPKPIFKTPLSSDRQVRFPAHQ